MKVTPKDDFVVPHHPDCGTTKPKTKWVRMDLYGQPDDWAEKTILSEWSSDSLSIDYMKAGDSIYLPIKYR